MSEIPNMHLRSNSSSARAVDDGDGWAMQKSTVLQEEILPLRYALIEVELESLLAILAPAVGRAPPALHRWGRARNGLLEIPPLATLKSSVAALRFQALLWQFAWRERKAGFDPNQPRVPRGQPGGGQWTDAGGGSGGSERSDSPEGGSAPLKITIHPRAWFEDGGSGSKSPPLGDRPAVPDQEPATRQALNDFAKQAAWWAAKALAREAVNPAVGTLLDAIDLAYWGYKAAPYVRAYLDPPKTLDELQRAVSNPATGYDIHHIVEKTAANDANYPNHMIDGPGNLVRIPTLKHWQITAWFMRRNPRYGGLSPRAYLRGKNWAERMKVGKEALIEFGVLKP